MNWPLLALSIALMVVNWVNVWRCWWSVEHFVKPGVMLALIAWFCLTTRLAGPSPWFLAGLVFGLLGDVFLMPPYDKFLPGLVAFLLGHLAYLVGFNLTLPPLSGWILPILVVFLIAAAWLYRRVAASLIRQKKGPVLRYGVAVYSLALTLMAVSASLTLIRSDWSLRSALLATSGGVLFFASDSMLALNRFVAPIPNGRLLVRITYHLGQLGLLLGLATHLV